MSCVITRDGTELFYKDWGQGTPLVFCHAWPLNADMWDQQMGFFAARGFRCIAHDRRGFGRSSKPWGAQDYDTQADDLATLIHALDLIDAVLIGASLGAGEVIRCVTRHGAERVARIALVSPLLPGLWQDGSAVTGPDRMLADGMQAALAASREGFMLRFSHVLYEVPDLWAAPPEALREWTFAMAMQAGLPATLAGLDAFSGANFWLEALALDLPILFLQGGGDRLGPAHAMAGAAIGRMPQARCEVIEGAPHGLWITHKDQVNAALLRFVQALEETGPG